MKKKVGTVIAALALIVSGVVLRQPALTVQGVTQMVEGVSFEVSE